MELSSSFCDISFIFCLSPANFFKTANMLKKQFRRFCLNSSVDHFLKTFRGDGFIQFCGFFYFNLNDFRLTVGCRMAGIVKYVSVKFEQWRSVSKTVVLLTHGFSAATTANN